jgi:hypothetical protein
MGKVTPSFSTFVGADAVCAGVENNGDKHTNAANTIEKKTTVDFI